MAEIKVNIDKFFKADLDYWGKGPKYVFIDEDLKDIYFEFLSKWLEDHPKIRYGISTLDPSTCRFVWCDGGCIDDIAPPAGCFFGSSMCSVSPCENFLNWLRRQKSISIDAWRSQINKWKIPTLGDEEFMEWFKTAEPAMCKATNIWLDDKDPLKVHWTCDTAGWHTRECKSIEEANNLIVELMKDVEYFERRYESYYNQRIEEDPRNERVYDVPSKFLPSNALEDSGVGRIATYAPTYYDEESSHNNIIGGDI